MPNDHSLSCPLTFHLRNNEHSVFPMLLITSARTICRYLHGQMVKFIIRSDDIQPGSHTSQLFLMDYWQDRSNEAVKEFTPRWEMCRASTRSPDPLISLSGLNVNWVIFQICTPPCQKLESWYINWSGCFNWKADTLPPRWKGRKWICC